MKIIVGLGNPEEKYNGTRHNVGFLAIDKLVKNKRLASADEKLSVNDNRKLRSMITKTRVAGEEVILVKPKTFMNLSGEAVSRVLQYYTAGVEDLIVISDDIDLRVGQARVRDQGSSGGHKGLQNIIDILGSNKFIRVRFGILGQNITAEETNYPADQIDTASYVLSKFNNRELPTINKIVDKGIEYIIKFIGKKTPIPAHTIEVE